MTTVTIELTVDQLFEAMRKLPEEDRVELLKRLGDVQTNASESPTGNLPGFGIWKDREDITSSAQFAEQLRRNVELRKDERQTD